MNSLEGNRNIINLFSYHNILKNKHIKLGELTSFIDFETPSEDEIQKVISIFKDYSIKVTIGG